MKLFDSKMLVFLGIKNNLYLEHILILKEHQALVSVVCMFDCDVPKNSEARINITRPKILLKHDLLFERYFYEN